jgi:hypothetical protein
MLFQNDGREKARLWEWKGTYGAHVALAFGLVEGLEVDGGVGSWEGDGEEEGREGCEESGGGGMHGAWFVCWKGSLRWRLDLVGIEGGLEGGGGVASLARTKV